MLKISDIAYINPENIEKTNEINYIDISSVGTGEIHNIKNIKDNFPSRAKRKIKKNDIIISTVRPNLKTYALIENDINNLVCSTGFVVIRPKETIYKDILYYILTSKNSFDFYEKNCEGSNYPSFKGNILNQLQFFEIRSIDKVLNILNKQKKIINKCKALLEKIEIRNQYYIEKILTGEYKVNNGKIIKTTKKDNVFKKEYLKNLFELRMGETILRDRVLCYCPDENFIPVYSATEESKIFGYVKRDDVKKILTANDLILSARGSIGFLKITDEIKTSTQTTIQMVSKSDFSTYLVFKYLQLNRKKFFVAEGAAIPQITIESIKNIEIPIFDNNEIELFLKKLDLEKEKIEKLLSLEEQRFEWLSDKLLSGEYIIED